jgi:aspartate carbamoyltransferase catalytic subunit
LSIKLLTRPSLLQRGSFLLNSMNNFVGRDIVSINNLTKLEIVKILKKADDLKRRPKPNLLNGQVLGTCFFEPSTRTRLSFETAMHKLGGRVVGFSDSGNTSVKKGESLEDTIKVIGGYVDALIIRHPLAGSAATAARATNKPVINGGDGANQHPTQTLLDLLSIKECQNRLDNLHIALVGDLKYGRTVHSLAQALAHFNSTLYLVSPKGLQMPKAIINNLKQKNIQFYCHQNILNVLPKVDIVYLTRLQKERFTKNSDYQNVKNTTVLTKKMLQIAKSNLRVLHPLPRLNELDKQIDNTKHAYYFEQAGNGVYVRQAVLGLVLGKLT